MNLHHETREAAARGIVLGRPVYTDISGVGHCWEFKSVPVDVAMEIEAEIIDGGSETHDGYTASNGVDYRW